MTPCGKSCVHAQGFNSAVHNSAGHFAVKGYVMSLITKSDGPAEEALKPRLIDQWSKEVLPDRNQRLNWFLFVAGLIIICGLSFWIRRSIDPPYGRDLYPGPDAAEYADMARRFGYFEGFGVQVSGAVVPSRYPALFPLILSPVARIFGGNALRYPAFMALLGSFSILLAGIMGARITGLLRGGILFAALLALSGSHIISSHVVMSDMLMLVLFQGAVLLALLHRQRVVENRPMGTLSLFATGILLGSLSVVRIPGALLAGSFALYYGALILRAWRQQPDLPRRGTKLLWIPLALLGGAVLPVTFEMTSRWMQFGSVFGNGYAYYIPSYRPGSGFHVVDWNWVTTTENGTRVANWKYFGKMVLGIDDQHQAFRLPWSGFLVYAGLAALVVQLVLRKRWEIVFIIICGPAALFTLHLLYFWQEPRLILIPVAIALLAIANLLAITSIAIGRALRLAIPARAGSGVGAGAFCVGALALLYLQKEPLHTAMHLDIPVSGMGGELRSRLHNSIDSLKAGDVPPVIVTNAGTMRVRNLLFSGPSSHAPLILSLTDSYANDEHVYRITRQEPYGIAKGHIVPQPLTVFTWESARYRGTGMLTPQENTLKMLRDYCQKSFVLLLLEKPDAEGDAALKQWHEQLGWDVQELADFSRYRLLRVIPPQVAD